MVLTDDLDRWLRRLPLAERLRLERSDEMMDSFRHRHEEGRWAGRKRLRPMCKTEGCKRRLGFNNRTGLCTHCADKARNHHGATCAPTLKPDTEG